MAHIRVRPTASGPTYQVGWRDEAGRQMRMSFPGDKQAAENFRRVLEANGNDLKVTKQIVAAAARKSPTLAGVIEQHITGLTSATPRTRAEYRRAVANHITPYIGHLAIDQISAARIKEWVGELADQVDEDSSHYTLSDKTIANVHGLLSAAMATAVAAGLREDNPCRGLRLPRRSEHEKGEMVCLTPAEWKAIDEALVGYVQGYYRPLFRFLIGTGCRWGEATALLVRDLSLDTTPATVRIAKAMRRDEESKLYVGPTKTRRSRRSVPLREALADELRELVKDRRPTDLVFPGPLGRPIHSDNARARAWNPAITAAMKAGKVADRPRIHDLRHTYASWLIGAGVDILSVSRLMGHESVTTTSNVYGHMIPAQVNAATAALAALLD